MISSLWLFSQALFEPEFWRLWNSSDTDFVVSLSGCGVRCACCRECAVRAAVLAVRAVFSAGFLGYLWGRGVWTETLRVGGVACLFINQSILWVKGQRSEGTSGQSQSRRANSLVAQARRKLQNHQERQFHFR